MASAPACGAQCKVLCIQQVAQVVCKRRRARWPRAVRLRAGTVLCAFALVTSESQRFQDLAADSGSCTSIGSFLCALARDLRPSWPGAVLSGLSAAATVLSFRTAALSRGQARVRQGWSRSARCGFLRSRRFLCAAPLQCLTGSMHRLQLTADKAWRQPLLAAWRQPLLAGLQCKALIFDEVMCVLG